MKLYHELSRPQLKARRTRWKKLTPKQQLAKWAKALRSGRYRQIRGDLEYRGTNCRCATGVLADISGDVWASSKTLACPIAPSRDFGEVARWNDRDRLSFRQIADRLEEVAL